MNIMTYKDFAARIAFDAEDEIFSCRRGRCHRLSWRYCCRSEAGFHEAVDDYVETCRKLGRSPQKPYSGKMMFRVDPEIHARAAKAAELAGKNLNQWAEEALDKASAA